MTILAYVSDKTGEYARQVFKTMMRGVSGITDDVARTRYLLHLLAIAEQLLAMVSREVDRHIHNLNDSVRMPVREIAKELEVPSSTVQDAINRVRRPDARTGKGRSRKSVAPEQRENAGA